jgi:hypothetical protein
MTYAAALLSAAISLMLATGGYGMTALLFAILAALVAAGTYADQRSAAARKDAQRRNRRR